MAKHHKRLNGACAYCERKGALTRDHVIPQCLFDGDIPKDLPIVHACHACNNVKKSDSDTFLRDALVCDTDAYHHPVVQRIIHSQFERAVQRNQSALVRYVAPRLRPVERFTPSSLFSGIEYSAPLPQDKISNVLGTMTRGLHRHYLHCAMPENVEFTVLRVQNVPDTLPIVQTAVRLGILTYMPVGDSTVFNCIYGVEPGDPSLSMWFLAFYCSPWSQGVIFRITTRARAT